MIQCQKARFLLWKALEQCFDSCVKLIIFSYGSISGVDMMQFNNKI